MPELRDRLLRAIVLLGVSLVAMTEALGAFSLIRRVPLAVCWIVPVAIAIVLVRRRGLPAIAVTRNPVVLTAAAGIAAILALAGVTAAYSPPNSTDAMAYHLPRVVYWAEQASVRFFPTHYLNLIMLQPLAEYAALHTYVLTGGDRLVSFVQWFASFASIIAVSAVACRFGFGKEGQAIAALFCATIPAGVLASSGAKNDYWLAMWLVLAVYFAVCFRASGRLIDACWMGAAIGLALLTKATAYLFAPWPLAAVFVSGPVKSARDWARGSAVALAIALALNAPQYWRNYELSGSVMGFDSAHGDGVFRWANDSFGWKPTVSNLMRHLSEQLGGRSPRWNRSVYEFVLAAHRRLDIDVNDRRTTWPGSSFTPPVNANHETNAPNRWHLAILLAVAAIVMVQGIARREIGRPLYVLALLASFVSFCAYLKWQPFMGRLLLPLYVLGAPMVAAAVEWKPLEARRAGRWAVELLLCLFLLSVARLPAIENWVRPLRGPRSVLHVPRDQQYFADLTAWNNQASYVEAVEMLAGSDCGTVGIDTTHLDIEYPLQALLRERKPGVRFLHVGVENASARYRPPVANPPCAVVCLDCADDAERLGRYRDLGSARYAGRFVIFPGQ